MSNKFGVFDLIIANVENVQLIRIVKNHYVDDQWNTIKDLHGLESLKGLSLYDRLVSRSFLARSLSLESSFRRSERVFQNCIAMLPINLKSKHEKAIAAFLFHNYAIFLGYIGRKNHTEYSRYITKAQKLFN